MSDLDVAMITVMGTALCLGMIHDRPELDDAALTDRVTADVLRALGMSAAEAEGTRVLPAAERTRLRPSPSGRVAGRASPKAGIGTGSSATS